MSNENETTTTTTQVAPKQELGFELTSVNQAYRLANNLSKSGLIPTALRGKPDDILVVLMSGRELGMPPMQSLRHLYVIEGRISMSAPMMLGRVLKSGKCDYFTCVKSDGKAASFKTRRKGSVDEVPLTFTFEDAQALNLAGRDNWKKQPAVMLRWRAVTALCRLVYPDIVEGIYSEDEAEDIRSRGSSLAGLVEVPPSSEAPGAIRVEDVMPADPAPEQIAEVINPETGEVTEQTQPEPVPAPKPSSKPRKTNPTDTQQPAPTAALW